jgi:hypothetical protein
MKKLGLILLVVVMAFGVAGCSKDKDADPVGTWIMTFDWGCDGSAGTVVWHIYTGGAFNDNQGNSGGWAVKKKDITLSYSNGTNYGGDVDDDRMSGTMTSVGTGTQGCWSAARTSTSP